MTDICSTEIQHMVKKAKIGRMINYVLIGVSCCSCCLSLYSMYLSDLVTIVFSCAVIAALIAIVPVDIYYLMRYSAKINPALKNWIADIFDSQRRFLEIDGDNICFECGMLGDKIIVMRSGIRGQIIFDAKPLKGYLSKSAATSYIFEYLTAYYYTKTCGGRSYSNVVLVDHMSVKPKVYEIILSSTFRAHHPEKNYFLKNDLINTQPQPDPDPAEE